MTKKESAEKTTKKAAKKPRAKKSAEEKKEKTKKSAVKKKKTKKYIVARGKRKSAIARARVSAGKGQVRVNKRSINSINNQYIKELILEPVRLAGEKSLSVNIYVNVRGGGVLGQAQATRTAIAKALVEYFEDDSLKSLYLERDRSLLVEDPRRVESKKFKGPKARARFQKSYR